MAQDLQSLVKELLRVQYDNALKMIECIERVWALEAVVIAIDQQAIPLLDKMRNEAHDKNQTIREELQKRLVTLESLLGQIGQKAPN